MIGGSGFYEFLQMLPPRWCGHPVSGRPASPSPSARWRPSGGFRAPARRGPPDPPHRIPYRANLWALRSLGVRPDPRAVRGRLACAPEYGPGRLVIPDQLVDRTSGRSADVLRRLRPGRCTCRSPTRTAPSAGSRPRRPPAQPMGAVGRRDAGGHRGSAVLHPGRVAVVRREGWTRGRHDRTPRGRARPRTGALLHDAGPGHRPRRGRRERARGSRRTRCSVSSAATWPSSATW